MGLILKQKMYKNSTEALLELNIYIYISLLLYIKKTSNFIHDFIILLEKWRKRQVSI